jgi:hypothetical protein
MLAPMLRRCLVVGLILAAGCRSQPDFVQIAPGVSVSQESIDEYADQHGLSPAEAKQKLAEEVMSSGDAGASALGGQNPASAEGTAPAQ